MLLVSEDSKISLDGGKEKKIVALYLISYFWKTLECSKICTVAHIL